MADPAHTFLFADLAGFTATTEAHGDALAVDLVDEFCGLAGGLAGEHGVETIKAIGDAVMLRGDDAAQAIRLGLRIVDEVGGRHGFPAVRVGMHTGPALQRGGDWFGATVNLAARVSAAARGGEVLLTAATRSHARDPDGFALGDRGTHRLRNVGSPIRLFAAVAPGARADEQSIDPVCRMAVQPWRATATLQHRGRTLYFCSLACVRAFADAPDRYVG